MANNRQNFKSKRNRDNWIKIICAVLGIALLAAVGTVLFSNGFLQERNEDNLIVVDENYLESRNYGSGIEFDVDDNGVIRVKGDPSGNVEALIQTVELDAGTYTLSGIAKPDQNKITLTAQWGNGEVCYAGLFEANGTFTLAEKTTVSIVLNICKDADIAVANRTIRPCLVKDKVPGEFWS